MTKIIIGGALICLGIHLSNKPYSMVVCFVGGIIIGRGIVE